MKLKDMFGGDSKKMFANIGAAVAFGIVLIMAGGLFNKNDSESVTETVDSEMQTYDYTLDIESKTEELLSMVDGAGRVQVMITFASEGETVYAEEKKKSTSQMDENAEIGDNRKTDSQTEENTIVMSNNGDGSTSPVVIKENSAEAAGIVIIAEGGDDVVVKDSLIRAAQALFDVPANKIAVFKMK